MRKIIYILSLVFAGSFMSCEDFLDTPSKSSLDESVIFANVTLTKMTVDGILEPMGQTNSYRGRFLTHYGSNTDIEWMNSTTVSERGNLSRYSNSATNTDMNSVTTPTTWGPMYTGIERANICIRGIRAFGNPQPGTPMGQYLGEALTYRAIYYADLLKAFGDVVARFEPISSETMYLAKSDRGVIYKQIIADLAEASNLVAWPNETSATVSTERINKAFVKAFRARLCLAAAGYSQYPDGIRRSNNPDLTVEKLYPIALQECKDVIESGKAKLEASFETLWKKNCQENILTGNESLWEIPFADGRGRHLYTYGVKHNTADQFTDQAQGGVFGPLPFVFYDYDVADTRRDVSCVPYRWGNAVSGTSKQELVGVNTWYFGKWRYEWMTRRVTSTNDDGVNKIYMRYAEVLLMAAEIENELNGPGAASDYLKQIRKRAFKTADWPTKVDAYVAALSSKDLMFNAIVKEHGFEFLGEMERKQALIRWNLLGTNIVAAKAKLNDLRNRAGDYADVPATVYYKYAADGVTLQFYGLNRGETLDMSGTYPTNVTYVGTSKIDDAKINSLYINNPDQFQFWPIWQMYIDSSNGMLKNDYTY